MKVNQEIENVTFSMNINSKLGMIRDNRFQIFDLETLTCDKISVPNESNRFYTVSDLFFVPDVKNYSTWVIDIGQTKKLNSLLSLPFNIEQRTTKDYFYPLTRDALGKKYIAKVDIRNLNIIEFYPVDIGLNGVRTILNDNSFLSINETTISAYEIKTNKEIWSKQFDDLIKYKKGKINFYFDPIVENDSVYLYLTDTKYSSIYSVVRLNIHTGKKENEFDKVGGVLTKHNGSIYMVRNGKIQKIDLSSNMLREFDFTDQLHKMEMSMYWDRFTLKDNLLYFIHGASIPKNSFGVADLESNLIVDNFHFPVTDNMEFIHVVKEVGNRVIVQLSEEKLIVMDK